MVKKIKKAKKKKVTIVDRLKEQVERLKQFADEESNSRIKAESRLEELQIQIGDLQHERIEKRMGLESQVDYLRDLVRDLVIDPEVLHEKTHQQISLSESREIPYTGGNLKVEPRNLSGCRCTRCKKYNLCKHGNVRSECTIYLCDIS